MMGESKKIDARAWPSAMIASVACARQPTSTPRAGSACSAGSVIIRGERALVKRAGRQNSGNGDLFDDKSRNLA